jgi:branched-chain amino acid transport system permease protein
VLLATSGFAAAIFGGLNSAYAALVGGVVLGVLQAFVAGYIDAAYQTEVTLVLIIVVMLYQSGRRSTLAEEVA